MKSANEFSWENFNKAPIVGIVRGLDEQVIYKIAEAYSKAGLTTLEVTMNTPNASKIIKKLSTDFTGLNIGAGTVCSLLDYQNAVAAGAQFIVTPIINAEVIKQAVEDKIPIFPGAYTPTEIYAAYNLGASAVKVFPATQLGPDYIKDVLAPLNTIKLLPTGGVSFDNIASFFEVGAVGVGMGSSLLHKELIANDDFQGLQEHFEKMMAQISDYI